MPTIAFFDVDKTLIKGYSGFYTTLILIQKGILKKRRLPLALFYRLVGPWFEGEEQNLRKLYQIAIDDMAGHPLEKIFEIGRECFERWIKPRVYVEGIELINNHKKQGDAIYLVTSGPYMTIRVLGEFLGVDGCYSAGPLTDEKGIVTPQLQRTLYYREGKVVAAQEVIDRHRADWKDCYYYADNLDDLFLLEKVGHPCLVNPDRKVLRVGKAKGWPILTFAKVLG